jgi:hypothetical protein
MSHGAEKLSDEDVKKIVEAEAFKLSAGVKLLFSICVLIGLLFFVQGYISGDAGRKHAWMALHLNFLYFFGISAALSGFAAVFHICNAQWARPLRRVFESGSIFFTYAPLFLIALYFSANDLFLWSREPIAGKEHWLTQNFVYFRDFLACLLLVFTITRVVKGSRALDIIALKSGLVKGIDEKNNRFSDVSCGCCEAGACDGPKGLQKVYDKMGTLSPLCVMAYAFVMSLLAFDLIMSVDPHWYSTMFGGFYFMSCVYGAMAFVSIGLYFVRRYSPLMQMAVKRKTLHDLGKLLFGFGIFWAYLFWSHYLPIWYGNMPEETAFIILRLRVAPWRDLAWLVLGMCFIIPFMMGLSRDLKQVPVLLACTGIISSIGLWLMMYLLFAPTIYPDHIPVGMLDVAVGIGFVGLFALSAARYLERNPLIPFGDLYLEK